MIYSVGAMGYVSLMIFVLIMGLTRFVKIMVVILSSSAVYM